MVCSKNIKPISSLFHYYLNHSQYFQIYLIFVFITTSISKYLSVSYLYYMCIYYYRPIVIPLTSFFVAILSSYLKTIIFNSFVIFPQLLILTPTSWLVLSLLSHSELSFLLLYIFSNITNVFSFSLYHYSCLLLSILSFYFHYYELYY